MDDTCAQSTPPTDTPVEVDQEDALEDNLNRAVHMAYIATTLAEKAFDDQASHKNLTGLRNTYYIHPHDVDTLLFAINEASGKIRTVRDLWTEHVGGTKPPAIAGAIAAEGPGARPSPISHDRQPAGSRRRVFLWEAVRDRERRLSYMVD